MALMFDACQYFDAFFKLAPRARRSIVIAGWEAEAKIGLSQADAEYPNDMREFFNRLIQKNKNLDVFISTWKPALYLKFDREFFAPWKWKRRANKKIRYRQEKASYAFGSCHEKIAVLDGNCAFAGGIDITKERWDRRQHALNGRRSVHDLQMALSGEAAKALQEYTGKRFPSERLPAIDSGLWPESIRPRLQNFPVALARTVPAAGKSEILSFYLDAIEQAKEYIYIENQYFTHPLVTEALREKLEQPDGPEVVIAGPFNYPGFFERAVFARARNKCFRRLIKADRKKRLRIVYPSLAGENLKSFLVVHSKFMAVDDSLLTVGSANLNRRSMTVDSELNICLESAGNAQARDFVRQSVVSLLAEHMGEKEEEISATWAKEQSLTKLTDRRLSKRNKGKALRLLPLRKTSRAERIFIFISPFVDASFRLPKTRFNLLVILLAAFATAAGKAVYDG